MLVLEEQRVPILQPGRSAGGLQRILNKDTVGIIQMGWAFCHYQITMNGQYSTTLPGSLIDSELASNTGRGMQNGRIQINPSYPDPNLKIQ